MKNHTKSKAQLIAGAKNNASLIKASNQAHLILTITVLWDCFNFTEDEINEFMDRYEELLTSYNDGKEDIHEMSKTIEELIGVKIL